MLLCYTLDLALRNSLHWTWRFSKAYIGIDALIKTEVDNGLDALVKCIMDLTLYRSHPHAEKGSMKNIYRQNSRPIPDKCRSE